MGSSEVRSSELDKHLGEECFEHKTNQTAKALRKGQARKGREAGTECEQGKGPDGLGRTAVSGLRVSQGRSWTGLSLDWAATRKL